MNDVIELDVIWDDIVEVATGFDNAGFNVVYRRELGEAEVNLGNGRYLIFQQTESRLSDADDDSYWLEYAEQEARGLSW